MQILDVDSPDFLPYGRVLKKIDSRDFAVCLALQTVPDEILYVPSDPRLEALPLSEVIRWSVFGGLPLQAGFCVGKNRHLNALEYHACAEVNVAATDLILLLGHRYDMTMDGKYPTEKVQAFFLPEGMAVELYSSTLHFAPCGTELDGTFKAAILLPAGVNGPLMGKQKRDALCGISKWVLKHADYAGEGLADALQGENIFI